jgi:hypothetical protein
VGHKLPSTRVAVAWVSNPQRMIGSMIQQHDGRCTYCHQDCRIYVIPRACEGCRGMHVRVVEACEGGRGMHV